MTNAALFTADGQVVQPADAFYKKCILVERGSFRPVTKVTLDMLRCAQAMFIQEPNVQGQDVLTLMEMTLKNLSDGDKIDHRDFLDRVDILAALGKTVLISNFGEYHRLAAYFFRYTKKMIGIAMGVPTLKEIFDEKYYADLSGGILESFGRMFKNDLKLYVYPLMEAKTGRGHHRRQSARGAEPPPLATLTWWRTGLLIPCAITTKSALVDLFARCLAKAPFRRPKLGSGSSTGSCDDDPRAQPVRLQGAAVEHSERRDYLLALPAFMRLFSRRQGA